MILKNIWCTKVLSVSVIKIAFIFSENIQLNKSMQLFSISAMDT